jgi:Protein of unknown function (DUF2628)
MTLYSIYVKAEPKSGFDAVPLAVPEKFSWAAALLTPLYALTQGLWLLLLFWCVLAGALVYASGIIGDEAAWAIYALVSVFTGFEAPALKRDALIWRGYAYRGDIIAAAEDLAQRDFLAARK